MSENNPYKPERPDYAWTDKVSSGSERAWEPRDDHRKRCDFCDRPMTRGDYVYVGAQGNAESKFDGEDYCSIRCLKRRVNGLPFDDERAMDALLKRVEAAEAVAKESQEFAKDHEANLAHIRRALDELLELAPGMVKGVVPPPGQLFARRVAALQSAISTRVIPKV